MTYDDGSVAGMNDQLSRLESLVDDDTNSAILYTNTDLGLGEGGGERTA